MATTLHYDADAAAQLVAIDLTPDMVAQRAAVLRALVPNAGRRVLALWGEHAAAAHLPRTLGPRLERTGFERVCVRVVPLLNAAFDPDTYSNRLIDPIASFAASRCADDAEIGAWARELRARDDYFFSLNRYPFFATRVRGSLRAATH